MQNKVAVLLWLYHTDLSEEFKDILFSHRNDISIFLGLCKDNDNNQAEAIFKEHFKDLDISYFDNAGTDILPTLNLLEKAKNYPIFFKLHSKKSNWGIKQHVNWRVLLTNDLLYKDNFTRTIKGLTKKDFAIAGSKSFIMRDNEYTNHDKIIELSSLLKIHYDKLRIKSFIGGNIFAGKTEFFDIFLENKKLKLLLSKEVGLMKDDNQSTYVHSMERLFGYTAEYYSKNILGLPWAYKVILNPKVKTHRLHLVKLYNNDCYIQENPNIYGTILKETMSNILIKWLHLDICPQIYNKHSHCLINNNVNSQTTI